MRSEYKTKNDLDIKLGVWYNILGKIMEVGYAL